MLTLIITTFWFFLPAGIANMSPVLFKFLNFFNYPIDSNKTFLGRPMFGKNKTYRGFFFGILMAILTVYIQRLLYPFMINYSFVDYTQINIFLLGFLFGFGALLGDLIESFFKRQLDIEPGKSFIPFDQIDWILGAIILVNIYISLNLEITIMSLVIFGLLHPMINLIGYALKIKKNKF